MDPQTAAAILKRLTAIEGRLDALLDKTPPDAMLLRRLDAIDRTLEGIQKAKGPQDQDLTFDVQYDSAGLVRKVIATGKA